MKTISVKEAALALGLSTRAVQYKLQNGDLKGTRTKNNYGVAEWRVWPNKEISEALKKVEKGEPSTEALNFSPSEAETVDAEEVSFEGAEEAIDEPTSWRQVEMERLELMAEKLMKPLAEKLEAQAIALREKDLIIEDQSRQLKLLPDLERRAREAEEDRKAAELHAMETEALRKQITALKDQVEQGPPPEVAQQLLEEKAAKEAELELLRVELECERKLKQEEITNLEQKLAAVDEYKQLAQAAQARVDELQQTVEERSRAQEAEKAAALEEMKRLHEEKSSESAANREELSALSKKLEKSQASWWKKWFSWGSTDSN